MTRRLELVRARNIQTDLAHAKKANTTHAADDELASRQSRTRVMCLSFHPERVLMTRALASAAASASACVLAAACRRGCWLAARQHFKNISFKMLWGCDLRDWDRSELCAPDRCCVGHGSYANQQQRTGAED